MPGYGYKYEIKYGQGLASNRTFTVASTRDDVNQIYSGFATKETIRTFGWSDNPYRNLSLIAVMVATCLDNDMNVNGAQFTRVNRDDGTAVDTTKNLSPASPADWFGSITTPRVGLPGQFSKFVTKTTVSTNGSIKLFGCAAELNSEGTRITPVLPTTDWGTMAPWTQVGALTMLLRRLSDFGSVRAHTTRTTPPMFVDAILDASSIFHGRSGRVGHKYGY